MQHRGQIQQKKNKTQAHSKKAQFRKDSKIMTALDLLASSTSHPPSLSLPLPFPFPFKLQGTTIWSSISVLRAAVSPQRCLSTHSPLYPPMPASPAGVGSPGAFQAAVASARAEQGNRAVQRDAHHCSLLENHIFYSVYL